MSKVLVVCKSPNILYTHICTITLKDIRVSCSTSIL